MFDFINNLFPEGTKPPSEFNLKNTYLKYGVTTNIDMKVKGANGSYEGKRKNAFLGNAASLLGVYEGALIQDVGIYDGMSNAIIGPRGVPEYELAEELLRKQSAWRNEVSRLRSIMNDNLERTNVVSVIYNMLRMYYVKLYGDLKYDGDVNFYDNGHVSVTNYQAFGIEGKFKLKDEVEIKADDIEMVFTRNPAEHDDCELFYDVGSRPEAVFLKVLRLAHGSWSGENPFLMAHSSPKLCEKFVLVNARMQSMLPEYSEISANQIKAVIGEFVRKMAAYTDFECAYGMLCSVITKPVPRSAEAIVWSSAAITVNMPLPCCIRGLAPEFYIGAQYARSPDWQDTFFSWYSTSKVAVMHSVALQEAVYTELFHLTRVTTYDDIDRDSFMTYATGLAECPNSGLMVDIVLACMRYGREYSFKYITKAGVDRLSAIPTLLDTKQAVNVKDSRAVDSYNLTDLIDNGADMNISAYAPITYPSLSYGVNEDGYYMNNDESVVKVKFSTHNSKLVFTDPAEFSRYMSMMRLFGYDVLATNVNNNKRIHNWADNASGRYIYIHDPNDVAPRFIVDREDVIKRTNSWMELPTLYGDVEFSYKLGKKALTWFSGETRIGFGSEPVISVKRTEFQRAVANMTQTKPCVRIVPLHRRSDFYETKLFQPASRPTLAHASAEMDPGPLIENGLFDQRTVPTEAGPSAQV